MESGQGHGKRQLNHASRLILILCLCLFWGCASRGPATPRPQIAYLHWLEKQSFVNRAPDLISQVSQSERVWLKSGQGEHAKTLLEAAPHWFFIAPESGSKNFFPSIAASLPEFAGLGIQGLYFNDIGEDLSVWTEREQTNPMPPNPYLATDEAFLNYLEAADAANIQTGSDLLPAVTGMGPDFILQARNAPGHRGVYAMLTVPRDLEPALPQANSEWDVRPISKDAQDKLIAEGILPAAISRDNMAWAGKSGWAATGSVQGIDGAIRRWLYRYEESPNRPALIWQDPGGATKQALAADIIKRTGLEGQALTGLKFGPWFGLEPQTGSETSYAHALDAINACALQIHQYGGWALLADPLPLDAMTLTLKTACDFCRDDIMPLLFIGALEKEDPEPLLKFYRFLKKEGIPMPRLAHGFTKPARLNHRLLQESEPLPDNDKFERLLLIWEASSPGLLFYPVLWDNGLKNSENWREAIPLARAAASFQLPLAELRETIQSGKVIANNYLLPSGKIWLAACNFSTTGREIKISIPGSIKSAIDPVDGADLSANIQANRQKFRLLLDGQQVRNVVFELE